MPSRTIMHRPKSRYPLDQTTPFDGRVGHVAGHDHVDLAGSQPIRQFFVVGFDHLNAFRAQALSDDARPVESRTRLPASSR